MYDIVPLVGLCEHDSAFADILVFTWSQHDNVTKVHDEGVHAVSLGRQLNSAAFGDQRSYLLHHYLLVYYYRAHSI